MPFDHSPGLRALGAVGGRGAQLVDEAFLIHTGEGLVTERGFGRLLDPSCVRFGAAMHVWRIGRRVLSPILRCLNMGAWPGGTMNRPGFTGE